MALSDFHVSIPVENSVYQFLVQNYGAFYKVTINDLLCGVILSSVPIEGNDMPYIKDDTQEFHIVFPARFYKKYIGCSDKKRLVDFGFSDNAIYIFNKMVRKMIRDELFKEMLFYKLTEKKQFFKSIRSFAERYRITEDDMSFDSLFEDFKRTRSQYERKFLAPC